MSDIKKVARLLSLVLRHEPSKIGIELDSAGWVSVMDLLGALNDSGNKIELCDLQEIVKTNNKQRFSFSEDGFKIRANQGHSIDVDLGLEPQEPPLILYHGTSITTLASIFDEGICKMSRRHVHLSDNISTATSVGGRHGEAFVLEVMAKSMYDLGHEFYLSKNGVWLTGYVPSEFVNQTTGDVF